MAWLNRRRVTRYVERRTGARVLASVGCARGECPWRGSAARWPSVSWKRAHSVEDGIPHAERRDELSASKTAFPPGAFHLSPRSSVVERSAFQATIPSLPVDRPAPVAADTPNQGAEKICERVGMWAVGAACSLLDTQQASRTRHRNPNCEIGNPKLEIRS